MKAKLFPEANFDFKRPQSMTEQQCYDLPTFRGSEQLGPDPEKDKFPCIISAWDVTDEDMERIRISKTLWLVITGTGMPPVRIQSEHPFIINAGEETAGQDQTETTEAALRRIAGEAQQFKKDLQKQSEIILRYEDVIKRCQRILGEQIDPLGTMEPQEAISQLLSILDNKDFCEFMGSTVTTIESGTICGPKEVLMQSDNYGGKEREEEVIRIERKEMELNDINTNEVEGKLLLAAVAMLTTSAGVNVLGKEINGRQTTPNDMLQHLISLAMRMDFRFEVREENMSKTLHELQRILPTKEFNPAWRETVKEIVVLSVDQQRIIKEMTEFIETTFAPIDEIQILEDKLSKAIKAGKDLTDTGKHLEAGYSQAMQLLREALPATIENPNLQERINDFLNAK